MEDLLTNMSNSAELTGWLEYLRLDDEVKAQWTVYAIAKAFNGDKKQSARRVDDEEVIDTTDPEFAKNFRGFTHTKPQQSRPNRQPMSTEIKIG